MSDDETREELRKALVAAFAKYKNERLDERIANAIREDVHRTVREHFRQHPQPHSLGVTAAQYRASGGDTDAPDDWMAYCRGFDVSATRETYDANVKVEFIPTDVFFLP